MSVEAARASVYKMAIEDDAHFRGWDERGFYVETACFSCTARMKLEETADAR